MALFSVLILLEVSPLLLNFSSFALKFRLINILTI